ncbi:MAG: hypothetical protein HC806_06165, partial [Anaerolineae bacterium]|nr:hypothetical protein [Anaerolineae bacterium]
MRATDLPLTYNAVNILEHNLPARENKTALFSLERNLTFAEVADRSQPGRQQRSKSWVCG